MQDRNEDQTTRLINKAKSYQQENNYFLAAYLFEEAADLLAEQGNNACVDVYKKALECFNIEINHSEHSVTNLTNLLKKEESCRKKTIFFTWLELNRLCLAIREYQDIVGTHDINIRTFDLLNHQLLKALAFNTVEDNRLNNYSYEPLVIKMFDNLFHRQKLAYLCLALCPKTALGQMLNLRPRGFFSKPNQLVLDLESHLERMSVQYTTKNNKGALCEFIDPTVRDILIKNLPIKDPTFRSQLTPIVTEFLDRITNVELDFSNPSFSIGDRDL